MPARHARTERTGAIAGALVAALALGPLARAAEPPPAPTPPAEPAARTAATEGVRLYLAGDYPAASAALGREAAEGKYGTVPLLYLGLAALAVDDLDGAVDAWSRLLAAEPAHPQQADLTRHLTVLRKRAAERAAKGLDEASAPAVDARRVAVLRFRGNGHPDAGVLATGLGEMLVTDLARVPALSVVERVRSDALAEELSLREAGLTDERAAPRVGRLLAAGRVASGTLAGAAPESESAVEAVLADAETGVELGATSTRGPTVELFRLEKELLFGLLDGFGLGGDALPAALRAELAPVHTTRFSAFLYYSRGIDHLDHERYDEAGRELRQALEEDPDFDLARKALAALPLAALGSSGIAAAIEGGAMNAGIGLAGTSVASVASVVSSAVGTSAASVAAAAGASAAAATPAATGLVAGLLPATVLGVPAQAVLIGAGVVLVVGGATGAAVAASDGGGGGGSRGTNVHVEIPSP